MALHVAVFAYMHLLAVDISESCDKGPLLAPRQCGTLLASQLYPLPDLNGLRRSAGGAAAS